MAGLYIYIIVGNCVKNEVDVANSRMSRAFVHHFARRAVFGMKEITVIKFDRAVNGFWEV